MEQKPEKRNGGSNLLKIILSVLLIASIILNIVQFVEKNNLRDEVSVLTNSNTDLATELDSMQEIADTAQDGLLAANQMIEQLNREAVQSSEAMLALQTDSEAALAAAVQQGKDDVQSAQDEGAQALAALQTEFDTYKAEMEASLQKLLETGTTEPAEDTADTQDAASVAFAPEDVVATVNGQPVTGEDVMENYQQVVAYYGEPDAESVEIYYAVAMKGAVTLKLIETAAAELGVDQYTQEELDSLYEASDSEWEHALDSYISSNITFTDETTDEEKAAAVLEAEAYFSDMGYTKESLRQNYLESDIFERVQAELLKDISVTDDDVLAYFNDIVQSDQETYEFDIDAYENQLMMMQLGYAEQEPWYRPEGYRYVKHILLPVDETLMANYTDLLARYEEQMNIEEEGDAAEADATKADAAEADAVEAEAPVTAEDIDAAKAAIITSVQDQVDEINAKLAEGVSFEELLAEYGTDPGMTSGSYPEGYEVSLSSLGFVPEFVAAAFSVDEIGEVSEPYLSNYGVHIVKYMGDAPAGPVELTDDLKTMIRSTLESEQSDAALNDWYASADIEYTGILRTVEQIQADAMEAVPEE